MAQMFDKNGIPIERGDVLKVFHFTGARRKQHFMFKQALGPVEFTKNGYSKYMKFTHLDLQDGYYVEPCDDAIRDDYEIVQSIDCKFKEREGRIALTSDRKGVKP